MGRMKGVVLGLTNGWKVIRRGRFSRRFGNRETTADLLASRKPDLESTTTNPIQAHRQPQKSLGWHDNHNE